MSTSNTTTTASSNNEDTVAAPISTSDLRTFLQCSKIRVQSNFVEGMIQHTVLGMMSPTFTQQRQPPALVSPGDSSITALLGGNMSLDPRLLQQGMLFIFVSFISYFYHHLIEPTGITSYLHSCSWSPPHPPCLPTAN